MDWSSFHPTTPLPAQGLGMHGNAAVSTLQALGRDVFLGKGVAGYHSPLPLDPEACCLRPGIPLTFGVLSLRHFFSVDIVFSYEIPVWVSFLL